METPERSRGGFLKIYSYCLGLELVPPYPICMLRLRAIGPLQIEEENSGVKLLQLN